MFLATEMKREMLREMQRERGGLQKEAFATHTHTLSLTPPPTHLHLMEQSLRRENEAMRKSLSASQIARALASEKALTARLQVLLQSRR